MSMLTNRLAAVAAGVFGPERAGDRRLADSKRAQLDQPSRPFTDPTRSGLLDDALNLEFHPGERELRRAGAPALLGDRRFRRARPQRQGPRGVDARIPLHRGTRYWPHGARLLERPQ